jgi:C-terminal processing protease CtpA/Prc
MLDDISTAVLSIPSFDSDVDSFSGVIVNFIERAYSADKVIIDLQQNTGGQVALALDAYRQV